jgi:hypothetical protein
MSYPAVSAMVGDPSEQRSRFYSQHIWIRAGWGVDSAGLPVSVGNSSAREVVGRQLNANSITHQYSNAVLAHLA